MDDSEDFVDLCSKLLRRVRKREAGERKYTEDESRPPNGVKERAKRKRLRIDSNQVLEGPRGSQTTNRSQASFSLRSDERGGLKKALEDAVVVARPTPEVTVPESTLKQQPLRAKDKVVSRMQQFKWVSPQKLKLNGCEEPGSEKLHVGILTPPREQEPTATPAPDPQGDEALALRLQQELDREAQSDLVDLEEGGLFFCQICQRDLSAINALCRAQHINRCLDKSEDRAPPMRAPPQIPECPICGKGFKSEKSKVAHLKRCSTDMGVAPAVLMEALQRQAAEVAERGSSTNQPPPPDRPKKKGPRKKPVTLDEDTMVAMALSRSMLEQDKEKEVLQEGQRGAAQALSAQPAQPLGSRAGCGKTCRKKGAPPAPPPLLLIQDPRDVLLRLQNRIAALLLRTQPERPPTPRLPASSLALWTGATPLWQKSALREGGPLSTLDFYTPELKPWVPANVVKLNPEGPCQTAAGTPRDSLLEARCSSSPSPAAKRSEPIPPPASSPPPVGNQTLCDLMDLAEEGMTLTQYGGVTTWAHTHTYKEQLDPLPNGFEPVAEAAAQSTAPLSRLATDLASMVNNPQLSDVQLQVDSGDVFFTHSFVLYARCPLLAQSVHDSGFGVQEEGMPLVQRVLLGEVPVDAVLALLQYLYTGCCPLTPALVTRVQELAVRFQLKELQELCQQHAGKIQLEPWGMELEQNDEEEEARNKEQNFMELLHSMWDGEEEEEEGGIHGKYRQEGTGSPLLGDVEPGDERVDEDELEEIYEFAATQRKLESGGNIGEDEEEDGEDCHADTEEGEGLMERGGGDCMSGKRLSLVKAGVFIEKLNSQGTDEPKEDSPPSQDSMVSCHSLRDGSAAGSPPEGQVYQMTADMMEQPALFTVSCAEAAMGPDDTGLVGSSKPSSVHSPNTSADRSYSRLFSQSWGTYTEPSPSQPPHHTPSASLAADFQCMEQPAVGVFTPVPGRASGHQGVVIDLSVSPSPDPLESSLPITGVSPGSTEGKDPEVIGRSSSFAGDPEVPLGHSQTETSHVEKCIPSSSGKTICSTRDTRPMTPDLIVVSDSGDEMDFITGNMEAKLPPISNQQPQISVNVGEKAVNPEVHCCNAHAPVRLSPSLPMNGSAEISWLIPFTPVQPHKTTQTGSTQTYSSMCRTNLFTRSLGDESRSLSPSSSFASPQIPHTLTGLKRTERLQHQAGVGPHIVDSTKFLERPANNSSTSNLKVGSTCGLSKGEGSWYRSSNVVLLNSGLMGDSHKPEIEPKESPPASIIPSSQLETSRRTSSQHRSFVLGDTDCSGVPPNASSTPLHLKVPDRLCAARPSLPQSDHVLGSNRKSPICRVTGNRIQSADERCSENQQGDDPGSLHLSVILPSPWRDAEIGSRLRESPDKHGFLAGPNCIESSDMARFSKSNGNLPEGEEESSLAQQPRELGQFCAAEEPPIPFDDSWGEGAHFSLRMDSSGGVSPPSLIPPAIGQDTPKNIPEPSATMLDSKLWDEWEGDEEEDLDLPLSQRACPRGAAPRVAQLRTPVASHRKGNPPLEPITPMPAFSDMETPELKNQLNKFGVRPLPKRQMVSKLREIHHYTHQLLSSDSESEGLVLSPDPPKAAAFKEPTGIMLKTCPKAPPAGQGEDGQRDGDEEVLSASQSSTTSSAAASEDSNRSNPELCPQSDDDSDSDGLTPSQAVSRDAAKLQAVRNFLQSDSELYGQILQYQPLVLAHLQARLKAAGIRLGAAKLLDFLDSQCITFTTANRTKPSVSRRRGLGRGRGRRRGGKAKALS